MNIKFAPKSTEEAQARSLRVDVAVELADLLGTADPQAGDIATLVS